MIVVANDLHVAMGVHRLNHAVLYVRDVSASTEFYGSVLDFRVVSEFPGAVFLRAPGSTNDHDRGALVGASNHGATKSLYANDPDGLEFEVVWIIPANLLTDDDIAARDSVGPLDLPAEIARFGRDETGGIGISIPSPRTPAKAT